MSISSLITVWCDYSDSEFVCDESIETGDYKARTARESIRDEGWTYEKRQDLCPFHHTEATV